MINQTCAMEIMKRSGKNSRVVIRFSRSERDSIKAEDAVDRNDVKRTEHENLKQIIVTFAAIFFVSVDFVPDSIC